MIVDNATTLLPQDLGTYSLESHNLLEIYFLIIITVLTVYHCFPVIYRVEAISFRRRNFLIPFAFHGSLFYIPQSATVYLSTKLKC